MTAFAMRLPGRRRSKSARLAKTTAKVWTSMKIGSVATRTAKKGAKAYGSWRVAKFVGRRGKKLLLVPLAAGGGLAAWKRLRGQGEDAPATPYGAPQGPAATSQAVSPPAPGPGGLNGEGAMSDPSTGAADRPPGAAG